MKKFFTLSLSLLTLLAIGVSCEKSTITPPDTSDLEVSFTTSINSRAVANQFEAGDEISVTAFEVDGATFQKDVLYTYSNGTFTSSTPITYEDDEQLLSFTALYPNCATQSDGTVSFSVLSAQDQEENYTLSDLMVSEISITNNTTPELVFDHLLSKIIINIEESDVSTSNAVITLNAKQGVEYDIFSKKLTTSAEIGTTTLKSESENTFKAIVAPQEFSTSSSFVSITLDGIPFEIVLDENKTFEAGKQYQFDVKIAQGTLTYKDSEEEWNEGVTYPDNEITSISIVENLYGSLLISTTVAEDFTGTYTIIPMSQIDYEMFGGDVNMYVEMFIEQDITWYGTDYTTADGVYIYQGDVTELNLAAIYSLSSNTEYFFIAVGADADGTINTAMSISESVIIPEFTLDIDVVFPDVDFGSINITSVEGATFTYDIIPNDTEMSYMVFTATKEYYDSFSSNEDRFIADMVVIANFVADFGHDLQTGLTNLSYTGERTGILQTNLDFGTDYVIYCYGIDIDAIQPLTLIEKAETTTEEYVLPTGTMNSITVSDITLQDAVATVDAGDYNGIYYWSLTSPEMIDYYFGGDLSSFVESQLAMEAMFGTSFTATNSWNLFEGSQSFNIGNTWTLDPFTEYMIYAIGVDNLGNMLGDPVSTIFTTAAVPDDFSVSLSVSDIGDDIATINAQPSYDGITYILDAIETKDYEAKSESELVEFFETYYSYMIDYYMCSGEAMKQVSLKPGRDYTVVAFAYYSSLGKCSEIYTTEFSTTGEYVAELEPPTEIILSDIEFGTMEASVVTDSYIELSIVPNDKNMHYIMMGQTTYDFELFSSDEELLADNFEYFDILALQNGCSYADILASVTFTGDYPSADAPEGSTGFYYLMSDFSYTFFAYGIDLETSQPLTEVLKLEVTTASASYAPAYSTSKYITSGKLQEYSSTATIAPRSLENIGGADISASTPSTDKREVKPLTTERISTSSKVTKEPNEVVTLETVTINDLDKRYEKGTTLETTKSKQDSKITTLKTK
ncbi:MAG: fimbrillin family protein [Rikenellaceae bacterium]